MAVLAALEHINIVKYYDCFTAERGRIQIVMELCEVCASETFQPMLLCCLQLQMSHSDIAAHMEHLIPKPKVRVGQERS